MSATIDLDDGRTWRTSNGTYDLVIEKIAAELNQTNAELEFAAWLSSQTCMECGPGLGSIDVRELSPDCRKAFRLAAERAYKTASQKLADGSQDSPEWFSAWLANFEQLILMWKAIDRGDPPGSCGESPHVWPVSGERKGPGWCATTA